MSTAARKAQERYFSRVREATVVPVQGIVFASGFNGAYLPSGVLGFNTTTKKLHLGLGDANGAAITSA